MKHHPHLSDRTASAGMAMQPPPERGRRRRPPAAPRLASGRRPGL